VGRKRLIEMSERSDVLDERLWMKVANLTGAAGNSTALVGTPAQVAEAMLRYYDLGVTAFVLKGFDPLRDAIDYGERLLPLVRDGAARRAGSSSTARVVAFPGPSGRAARNPGDGTFRPRQPASRL
jgi:alkanesulfonate monooxygenase